MSKKENKSKIMAQVQGYKIVQTPTITSDRDGKFKKVSSTKIGIFTGKKEIESGFKNKETAIERAKVIFSNKR